ncbi:MAG: molybdopterin-guanine dinucleotide biosynthesis protein B [Magnetospirillum sp.]|nr:molybdopterin-guanine dinucleotide biosynthesis protein B [Magnetospirillum sp.]
MRVFGLAGHSGSGKTTLLVQLVPWLIGRGWRVSTIKQANVKFDIDNPGKDSYAHRLAGAAEVLVASTNRWALMHEYRGEPEFTMEQLLSRMSPVDLVLVEGFRTWAHPRLEVWRAAVGKPPIHAEDPRMMAVATNDALPECRLPCLPLDDIAAVGRFVAAQTGLEG